MGLSPGHMCQGYGLKIDGVAPPRTTSAPRSAPKRPRAVAASSEGSPLGVVLGVDLRRKSLLASCFYVFLFIICIYLLMFFSILLLVQLLGLPQLCGARSYECASSAPPLAGAARPRSTLMAAQKGKRGPNSSEQRRLSSTGGGGAFVCDGCGNYMKLLYLQEGPPLPFQPGVPRCHMVSQTSSQPIGLMAPRGQRRTWPPAANGVLTLCVKHPLSIM